MKVVVTCGIAAVRVVAASAVLSTAIAGPLAAQYLGGGSKTAAEAQVADLEAMRDKFVALAELFPDTLYDWRPVTGVRSVRDVMALIAAEGTLFPTMWEFPAPAWVAEGGIGGELNRLRALSKDGLVTELRRSFDHVVTLSRGLTAQDRQRQVRFFGLGVDLGTALTLMQTDMHEHLGQAIAYARMQRLVPPWSQ